MKRPELNKIWQASLEEAELCRKKIADLIAVRKNNKEAVPDEVLHEMNTSQEKWHNAIETRIKED